MLRQRRRDIDLRLDGRHRIVLVPITSVEHSMR